MRFVFCLLLACLSLPLHAQCCGGVIKVKDQYLRLRNDIDNATAFIESSKNAIDFQVIYQAEQVNLTGMTNRNNKIIAVGNYQRYPFPNDEIVILNTNDTQIWKLEHTPIKGILDDVVYGKQFVAVGNVILTSDDGIKWDKQEVNTNFYLHSIAWNSKIYVAVGREGVIMTSTDGKHWKHRASGTDQPFKLVTWDEIKKQFVAVVDDYWDTTIVSENGLDWHQISTF